MENYFPFLNISEFIIFVARFLESMEFPSCKLQMHFHFFRNLKAVPRRVTRVVD